MTRKLFAFLAMLSGLAALSGPAAASYAHTSTACNSSVSTSVVASSASEQVRAERVPRKASANAGTVPAERTAPTPQSLRLPVLMGIDRAYE